MKDLIIIGAGGFGREVKNLIEELNSASGVSTYNILGFVDDGIKVGTKIHGYDVLGDIPFIKKLKKKPALVLAIGSPELKAKMHAALEEYEFPRIVHPSVNIEKFNVAVGKGSIICEGTVVTCDIRIGKFTILNLNCTVGHDVIIGAYSSVMPGVNISGEVELGEAVYVGTGATIINRVSVGTGSVIGAGAVVVKDIPEYCTAVGMPAKPIKFFKQDA